MTLLVAPGADLRRRVADAVEDRILETHRLVSGSDVEREIGAGSRRALDELVTEGTLVVLYEGSGLPKIYAPAYMFDEALRKQRKPAWVRLRGLPGRDELEKSIDRHREDLRRLDVLERLLYATGTPLEEAVAAALKVLGFTNVRMTNRPDQCDIRFTHEGHTFLAEAKGKSKHADKDDVLQLSGWVDDEVEAGAEPDELSAVLVVNHFRHDEPQGRSDALSTEARRLAKRHGFGLWTTPDLHERVRSTYQAHDRAATQQRHRAELMRAEYFGGKK